MLQGSMKHTHYILYNIYIKLTDFEKISSVIKVIIKCAPFNPLPLLLLSFHLGYVHLIYAALHISRQQTCRQAPCANERHFFIAIQKGRFASS